MNPPDPPHGVLTRGTIFVAEERCKGCGLCVPVCPPDVLAMSSRRNSSGYVLPDLAPGCTGCMACAEICPDFAIEVWKFDEPVVVAGAEPLGAAEDPR